MAKINRALSFTIIYNDIQDFEGIALSIVESVNEDFMNKYGDFYKTMSRTYSKFCIIIKKKEKLINISIAKEIFIKKI